MDRRSPLEDAETAGFAWARYRRMMWLVAAVTLVVTLGVLAFLYWQNGPVSVHFYIASGLGVAATMLTAGALMGLAFLSNGTGHDESVRDFDRD